MERLEAAGVLWLKDYSSIDLQHEDMMLEICGIDSEESATRIRDLLAASFTGLSFDLWLKDYGIEIGWIVEAYFPKEKIQ